jgi:hypothetical protein
MAALLGDLDEATAYFARARLVQAAAGQRPLNAIADRDEALALLRAGWGGERVQALLDAALAEFRVLGMQEWERRTRASSPG